MKLIAVCANKDYTENCDFIFCCSKKHLTLKTYHTSVIILLATVCFASEAHKKPHEDSQKVIHPSSYMPP